MLVDTKWAKNWSDIEEETPQLTEKVVSELGFRFAKGNTSRTILRDRRRGGVFG